MPVFLQQGAPSESHFFFPFTEDMQILDFIRPYHSLSIKGGNHHLRVATEATSALISLNERKSAFCVFTLSAFVKDTENSLVHSFL